MQLIVLGLNHKTVPVEVRERFAISADNIQQGLHHLDDYETGLLKTRAGIPYRDENLSQTSSVIIHNRELEVENSNLISSSRYIKNKGVLK